MRLLRAASGHADAIIERGPYLLHRIETAHGTSLQGPAHGLCNTVAIGVTADIEGVTDFGVSVENDPLRTWDVQCNRLRGCRMAGVPAD